MKRIIEEDGTEIRLHKTDNVVAVIIDGVVSSSWELSSEQIKALKSVDSLAAVHNVLMA